VIRTRPSYSDRGGSWKGDERVQLSFRGMELWRRINPAVIRAYEIRM